MATNDTIADMLTRIRNAMMARHQTTTIPATKMTLSIAGVLKQEGFISEFEEVGEGIERKLVLSLKYKARPASPLFGGCVGLVSLVYGFMPTTKICLESLAVLALPLFPLPKAL